MDLGAWKDEAAAKEYQSTKPGGEVVFDVTKWLSRVTLDIIGVGAFLGTRFYGMAADALVLAAGFGYEFNALDKEENKLAGAFASMMCVFLALRSSLLTPSVAGHLPQLVRRSTAS